MGIQVARKGFDGALPYAHARDEVHAHEGMGYAHKRPGMRIHHVVPHFHPDVGGVETHVLKLCQYLRRRGHEVVVHTCRRSYRGELLPTSDEIDGILIRRYRPMFRLGYYLTLFRPDILGADLVHLHGYAHLANDWTARRTRGHAGCVFSLHHGVAQPPPTVSARLKRFLYDPFVGRRTLRIVDALIVVSEADRRWLEARGIAGERVHVIPTGLDASAFEQGFASRARERFGLGRYVLFVGRIHREKSIDTLLRAFAQIRREDVSLVLAGPDAGAMPGLEALAARLHLGDRVRFLGRIDERTKRDLLAGCECLVLPSFYEAQGLVILEAWAQGRPIVASRVGGVPDLVSDGRDGLLFEWGDVNALAGHLRTLLDDVTLAEGLGKAGQVKARNRYAWEQLAPRVEEVYHLTHT